MSWMYSSNNANSSDTQSEEKRTRPFWTRRQVLHLGASGLVAGVIASPFMIGGSQAVMASPAATLPWPQANDIVAQTTVPTFPNATFPVTNYGAKGDGKTDNTAAFAKAIAACNAAGGGHVVVPAGTYSTGAIHLLSNVDF
ncbi:MAG TPA: glycosyl hydrolase family 28-related protein, partial [Ktedonobacteraceae bacterium]|nr:glycosyl hydrolase family 28-related protein [Ktedonobacteraceae bacterium]